MPPKTPASKASLSSSLRLAALDIKLTHSVFALPFALLGAALAAFPPGASSAGPAPRDHRALVEKFALIILCMVLARTWAMLINRIADARIDAANPRTAGRAVASGRLPPRTAMALALACALGFTGAAAAFWPLFSNPWPLALALPVLAWLALYSYAKRFTLLCHMLLGSALAISPISAALAIDPSSLAHTPALYALSAMVLCWVAGFDIIYALQDESFDRARGLHSIPAALGPRRAVYISRTLHAAAVAALFISYALEARFGLLFLTGVAVAALCLIAEHIVLQRRGLAGLPLAFFTLNGIVSCTLGALGITDCFI
ncbi:putative 4-hydroxybenzoate polyprenyltransferase [soil metagenome]